MIFIKQFSRYESKCKLTCKTILVILLSSGWLTAHKQLQEKNYKNWSHVEVYVSSHNYKTISSNEYTFWQVVAKSCVVTSKLFEYNNLLQNKIYERAYDSSGPAFSGTRSK